MPSWTTNEINNVRQSLRKKVKAKGSAAPGKVSDAEIEKVMRDPALFYANSRTPQIQPSVGFARMAAAKAKRKGKRK